MYLSVLISLKVFHCIGEYVCGKQHILKTLVNWGTTYTRCGCNVHTVKWSAVIGCAVIRGVGRYHVFRVATYLAHI